MREPPLPNFFIAGTGKSGTTSAHVVQNDRDCARPLFLCPQCRDPLPVRPPCSCGFVVRESDGVINLMTDKQLAEVQPFIEAYEHVRSDEGWGGDDLDLPFHPLRHREIWGIRRRTFLAFEA